MTPQCRPLAGMKIIRNRSVAGVCFFGKMAGSGRCSRSKGVAAGLIRRKAGFRAFSFSLRFRFVGLIRRKPSA
ncbi:MAG: hypothetical protein K0S42_3624 [Microvirga sp.]|nr:hypothetical protein [Microvirga sp.]